MRGILKMSYCAETVRAQDSVERVLYERFSVESDVGDDHLCQSIDHLGLVRGGMGVREAYA